MVTTTAKMQQNYRPLPCSPSLLHPIFPVLVGHLLSASLPGWNVMIMISIVFGGDNHGDDDDDDDCGDGDVEQMKT